MILVPFPDFEKSIEYLPLPLVFRQAKYYILNALNGAILPEESRLWKYHYYKVCEYGLLCIRRTTRHGHKFPLQYQILKTKQSRLVNTGLPEWWGINKYHRQQKELIDDWTPQKFYMPTYKLYLPKVDLKERLSRLQPILRKGKNSG